MIDKITMADFNHPDTMRDPISFYKRLAEQHEPLFRIDDVYGMGAAWVALRYDDVAAILKDPRFIKDMRKLMPPQNETGSTGENSSAPNILAWFNNLPNMLSVDPPDHTRLRRLAAKAFTPQIIEGLRPRVQQIADQLLDDLEAQGKMDLMKDYAYPLPIIVISEMLGISEADGVIFRDLTQKLMGTIMNVQQGDTSTTIAILEEFIAYIRTLLDKKRDNPADDVTSALILAHEQGDKLSENELLSTIWLLIVAGHETTVNLIGNGVLALLQHPEQMRMLRDNPALLPSAVEELLRYAGPVVIGNRFAGEDIPMRGKLIRKGEMVLFSLSAANIDPHKFTNPENMDITREENEHLAFGKGIHLCLGAPLARLEGQIAFGTLLRRFPDVRLAVAPEQLTYNYSKFRSLASLPLKF